MHRLAAVFTALVIATPAVAQPADLVVLNGVIDQGLNHSQVMQTAAWLTDRIGPRMTNSPQMRQAEEWTQQQFRDWGLSNVRADAFEFGRGWTAVRSSARMTAPRPLDLRVIPVAWTPSTDGTIEAEIVVAPMSAVGDFERWRGKLAGKIVLVSRAEAPAEPTDQPFFRRLTDADLAGRTNYVLPNHAAVKVDAADFALQMDAFLKEEGALAWVRMSQRDGGLLHGNGYTFRTGATPTVPGVELTQEDYRRLVRLSVAGAQPRLELLSTVQFHDEDVNAYNILADIPGTSRTGEYVMAGAHLDSWAAGDGAVDNAAGVAVVMEAARILKTLGVRPKRTIRFALWNGEEQGLLGSLAYVDRYLATRAPLENAEQNALPNNRTWRARWPVQPREGHRDLVAYFNFDNGSGRIRGINAEGNVAAAAVFEEWLKPFNSMGATTVSLRTSGGTDHVYMQTVGVPGFQFIQDPLDYGSRLHHTSIDTYDHLRPEDLRQAAIVMAGFLLAAANSDEPLPRMPLPTQPTPTDPFASQ
ncbi:MAG: M20/M25/M40 family metallo-hydrolase [Caulobacterales bacterium]|nr:M20/M25/M40 family metallo-hydrolase [Caulobacterales bacterium]